jgi:prepilin-type N-terminal cleavage/methylation domain-containing protein
MACRLFSTSRVADPRGFTLTESLLASVLLAVIVTGLCTVVAATHQNSTAGEQLATAHMLARQLMEEIAARPYGQLGDYHGYSQTSSGLAMADGTTVPLDGGAFRREVAVQYRASPAGPNTPSGDFAVVTVTVTSPGASQATLRQLFANVELRR